MNHEEWLRKSYESILKSAQTGDCDKDECEPAESENAAPTDADSREKLEADVMESCEHFYTTERRYDELIKLLDRQAAITRREVIEAKEKVYCDCDCCKWEEERQELQIENTGLKDVENLLKQRIAELEERVWIAEKTVSARELELKEERDYWKGQFRSCLGAAAKDGYALGLLMYPRPDNLIEPFLVVTSCIDDLRDCLADENRARAEASWERDHWRETAGRLSDEIPLDEKLVEQSHAKNAAETPDFAENPQKTPEQTQEIVAKDGKPIRIGETLTGENGIAWTVKGFNRESNYSVIATNSAEETRHLKPEWLTHAEQRICDTCRFYTHVSDGTGDCHRWPREFVKDPDDWCGEWSK